MLTNKQEAFVLNLFKGLTQRESWIQAGYSSNYPLVNIDSNACQLASKTKIKQRLDELKAIEAEKLIAESVADKTEILQFHSKLVRAKGNDIYAGTVINRENTQVRAAGEIAKLQGYYAQPDSINVNQDNRVINIVVRSEEAAKQLELVAERTKKLTGGE